MKEGIGEGQEFVCACAVCVYVSVFVCVYVVSKFVGMCVCLFVCPSLLYICVCLRVRCLCMGLFHIIKSFVNACLSCVPRNAL